MKSNIHLGFTLIELVIVIVILGILSAVAAPKFLDLNSDARIAKLESLEGTMRSAADMVYLKAKIEEKTDCSTDPTVDVNGQSITLRCGYPCPHPSGIAEAIDADETYNWIGGNCAGQLGAIDVQLSDAPEPSNCKIRYASARETSPPSYTATLTGC